MKLFVFEMVTGGGLAGETIPPGLAREGDLMVSALLRDLRDVPGARLSTSRDRRLPPVPGIAAIAPAPGEEPWALYARGAGAADAAWPVAPETGGALERLARDTLALGKRLIGSRPDAVRLTASKRETVRALDAAGIPVVPTFTAGEGLPAFAGTWVVKPDGGAGCEGVRTLPNRRAAAEYLAEDPSLVAQPWVEGPALSLSLLCGDGRAALLSCNRQHVRHVDGRLLLRAITVNALADRDGRLARLAGHVAAAIPGLWGYVGVDLVLAAEGPVVLEINPRLTTSYCGLRAALGVNVAALVLDLLDTGRMRDWRTPTRTQPAHVPLADDRAA